MATVEQIVELRELINEPDDSNGWTDTKLGAIIDGEDSVKAAASAVWYRKASQYATMVDVSESGSSRKLSDLHKNALTMGAFYRDASGVGNSPTDAPVVSRIRRGFS